MIKKYKVLFSLLCMALILTCEIGLQQVFAAETITSNNTGQLDGYSYELWKDSGNTSMTLGQGGTFSCQWSNINNALFRRGIKLDSTKTYDQIGKVTVDYSCEYNPSGNSYLCVYGWSVDPLVEYYIVDSWGSWRPPGGASKGTVTIDGGTYDIYETTRVNQPSIQGTATFKQFWSVRTSKQTSGKISVDEHFKAWEKMGMKLGKLYEIAFTIEGYQSSGSANVTKNIFTMGASAGNNSSNNTSDTSNQAENNQVNNGWNNQGNVDWNNQDNNGWNNQDNVDWNNQGGNQGIIQENTQDNNQNDMQDSNQNENPPLDNSSGDNQTLEQDNENPNDTYDESPKTSDTVLVIVVALLAIVSGGCIYINNRKRRYQ